MFSSAPWMTAPVIGSTRVDGCCRRLDAISVVHRPSPATFRMRLPAASLIAVQPGGMTVVEFFCSTMAGPAKALADRQQMPAVERGFERAQLAVDAENALAGPDPRLRQCRTFRRGELVELRHVADPDHPDVDDLDRVGGEGMPVFALVRLVKARPDVLKFGLADDAARKRYLELVALADITQIAVAYERHAGGLQMIGRELLAQLQLPSPPCRR